MLNDKVTNKAVMWQEEALVNQGDYLAKMLQELMQKAINEQFNEYIKAKSYERTEGRRGYRNGSYERAIKTRVGSMTLSVCRDREGNFQPTVFERYKRSEKAFVASLVEMYLSGVSTRKVGDITKKLCGFKVSKSLVSEVVKQLDEGLEAWRNRWLEQIYTHLIMDARYEKIRENGRIVSKGFITIVGITADGIREVIGCFVVNGESYEAWNDCIKKLVERGLKGVKFVVTDENKGLKAALLKHFPGVILQRCQVHYMRNFLHKIAKSDQKEGLMLLQDVFAAPTLEDALDRAKKVYHFLKDKKKDTVAEWFEDTVEEALAVYHLPVEQRKKMKSTNMVERLNQALKKRSRVVRIFPNEESCLRLLSALCQEISEQWLCRKYLEVNESFGE